MDTCYLLYPVWEDGAGDAESGGIDGENSCLLIDALGSTIRENTVSDCTVAYS